jgi:energy-coupling factor transporter ATP-binding protein EcfA2
LTTEPPGRPTGSPDTRLVVLRGPSGAGKSSTARELRGLIPAVRDEDDVRREHVHQALHVTGDEGEAEPLHDPLLLGTAHVQWIGMMPCCLADPA